MTTAEKARRSFVETVRGISKKLTDAQVLAALKQACKPPSELSVRSILTYENAWADCTGEYLDARHKLAEWEGRAPS